MKIITIIRDDYFYPVVYGVVEIPEEKTKRIYDTNQYKKVQNQIKNKQRTLRVRQK